MAKLYRLGCEWCPLEINSMADLMTVKNQKQKVVETA